MATFNKAKLYEQLQLDYNKNYTNDDIAKEKEMKQKSVIIEPVFIKVKEPVLGELVETKGEVLVEEEDSKVKKTKKSK